MPTTDSISLPLRPVHISRPAEESNKRREALSYRDARPGDRKVTFRKPNAATDGITLGLKFREGWGKAVFIDKIFPNSEAARLEKAGQISVGDEITMVSATFGDEMWSARGIGKMHSRSPSLFTGMTISFVTESTDKNKQKNMKAMQEKADKEAARGGWTSGG